MSVDALPPPRPRPSSPDSLIHKLSYTPLRDLLRGRLTARLDVGRIYSESGLPPLILDLVRTTVRRTRLRWGEKTDVARELIAHFRDGLEAGVAPDELARSFGGVAIAARLIRRARKRQRSFIYRGTMGTLKYGLLIIFGTYLLLTVRYYLGSNRLARHYLKEFNAPVLATRPEDRAWPIYRRAYLATSPWPSDESIKCESPACPGWDKLTAYASANTEALRLYRKAAAKPLLGMALSNVTDVEVQQHNPTYPAPEPTTTPADSTDNPPLISIMLPNLSLMRFGGRLLKIDAMLAAEQGDAARFVDDVFAIFAMAEHCAEHPFLISDLVAIAILGTAEDAIQDVLSRTPALLDDAAWVRISHRLAAIRGGGTLRMRLEGEQAFFHDVVQRSYTDDGLGDGHLRPNDNFELLIGA